MCRGPLLGLCAFALLLAVAAERAEPGPGRCHKDCTKFGNCGDNGRCRCPFGRVGEACEIDFLNPCKSDKGGIPNCGLAMTKSCECMRRCQEYFCRQDSAGTELCEGGVGHDLRLGMERGCYEREGVPPDEQYSKIPEPDEPNVKCFSGHKPGARPLNCSEALVQGGEGTNAPMSRCPDTDNCSNRGYCIQTAGQTEGHGSCRCHRGYVGAKCEHQENVCYRQCSGRGKCIDQFCHCEPPYFSIGCTRSKVYPANYSRPSPVNFKIYMYELNTQLAYDNAYFVGWTSHDPIYTAYQKFMDQFLVSPVRTEDPSEANLFYIPSFTYSYSGNVGTGNDHIHLLLDHIKHKYPFWNRTNGRDHFFWAPADRGACGLSDLAHDPIRIVHFGHHTTPENHGHVGHIGHEAYGCFNPVKDVVTVSYWPAEDPFLEHTAQMSLDDMLKNKTRLFFFAGGVRPELDYS